MLSKSEIILADIKKNLKLIAEHDHDAAWEWADHPNDENTDYDFPVNHSWTKDNCFGCNKIREIQAVAIEHAIQSLKQGVVSECWPSAVSVLEDLIND